MNDQIVELSSPGFRVLLYSPPALSELEAGGRYAARLPDGRDLTDCINSADVAAFGTRWDRADYWIHFSTSMDHTVIAQASDHVLLGVQVSQRQLCVRGGDDLFEWKPACPGEQILTLDDGYYHATVCMLPFDGQGAVRIYVHMAPCSHRPDLGYGDVPELYCVPPVV